MARKKYPPMGDGEMLVDPIHIVDYSIGTWSKGLGDQPSAVGVKFELDTGQSLLMKLNTPLAVDELIQMLLRHKRDAWPDAA